MELKLDTFHRMYQDKLATLKEQLVQLDTDVHPEYLRRVKKIEQAYSDRILLNEAFLSYEVSNSKFNALIVES